MQSPCSALVVGNYSLTIKRLLFQNWKLLKFRLGFFFSTELAGAAALESLLEFLEDTPFKKQWAFHVFDCIEAILNCRKNTIHFQCIRFTAATNGAIKVGNSSLIIKCYFRILKYSIFNCVFFLNSVGGRAMTVQIRYPYNLNLCKWTVGLTSIWSRWRNLGGRNPIHYSLLQVAMGRCHWDHFTTSISLTRMSSFLQQKSR